MTRNYLKKVTAKHLWIYIGVAWVSDLILAHALSGPLMKVFQAFYLALPTALQNFLHPVSASLAELKPTATELSILFAANAVENLGMLIEYSIIGAVLWLIYKGVSKIWKRNNTTI